MPTYYIDSATCVTDCVQLFCSGVLVWKLTASRCLLAFPILLQESDLAIVTAFTARVSSSPFFTGPDILFGTDMINGMWLEGEKWRKFNKVSTSAGFKL